MTMTIKSLLFAAFVAISTILWNAVAEHHALRSRLDRANDRGLSLAAPSRRSLQNGIDDSQWRSKQYGDGLSAACGGKRGKGGKGGKGASRRQRHLCNDSGTDQGQSSGVEDSADIEGEDPGDGNSPDGGNSLDSFVPVSTVESAAGEGEVPSNEGQDINEPLGTIPSNDEGNEDEGNQDGDGNEGQTADTLDVPGIEFGNGITADTLEVDITDDLGNPANAPPPITAAPPPSTTGAVPSNDDP